jgi:hypothetical protein
MMSGLSSTTVNDVALAFSFNCCRNNMERSKAFSSVSGEFLMIPPIRGGVALQGT